MRAGTCQHTCETDAIEKCKHAWTLRYWVNGKQLEKSFKDEITHGRVATVSGRKLAQDFQLKLTVDKRSETSRSPTTGERGKQNSAEAAEAFISRLPSLTAASTTTGVCTASTSSPCSAI